jgi:hypothetical protein
LFLKNPGNRSHYSAITRATAQIAAKFPANAAFAGIGQAHDNVSCGDQHGRSAKAALQSMLAAKGITQLLDDGVVFEPLNSRDLRLSA